VSSWTFACNVIFVNALLAHFREFLDNYLIIGYKFRSMIPVNCVIISFALKLYFVNAMLAQLAGIKFNTAESKSISWKLIAIKF
jgi:hypothetical protein